MKGTWIKYSRDELAFIEVSRELPRREAHALFCDKFGRSDVSFDNFKALCTRKGWKTGRTGCFPAGHVPENRGKPCLPGRGGRHPNAQRTQFSKGQLPHNAIGAGHERIDNKDGYVVMIVEETNPWTGAKTRPVHKHRYLWEKVNGPIPEGHVLKCLDGDKTNCDPLNWELIPRAMLPYLNGRHSPAYDTALPEAKPAVLTIAKLKHRVREITGKGSAA